MTLQQATSLAGLPRPVGSRPTNPPNMHLPLGRPAPNFGLGLACQDPHWDPGWWFAPDRDLGLTGDDAEHAKKLCKTSCPALHECLAWALATGEPHGVWGGMDPGERRRVRRNLRRSA